MSGSKGLAGGSTTGEAEHLLAALQSRVAELEVRQRELDDERAIRDLIAAYGATADSGQHERFVGLFTQDGTMELFGGEPSGTYPVHVQWQGHDELWTFITDPNVHMAIQGHCMHLPTINLSVRISGDQAVAESCALVLVQDGNRVIINGAGFTRWVLTKIDGRWLIKKRQRHAVGTDAATLARSVFNGAAS